MIREVGGEGGKAEQSLAGCSREGGARGSKSIRIQKWHDLRTSSLRDPISLPENRGYVFFFEGDPSSHDPGTPSTNLVGCQTWCWKRLGGNGLNHFPNIPLTLCTCHAHNSCTRSPHDTHHHPQHAVPCYSYGAITIRVDQTTDWKALTNEVPREQTIAVSCIP